MGKHFWAELLERLVSEKRGSRMELLRGLDCWYQVDRRHCLRLEVLSLKLRYEEELLEDLWLGLQQAQVCWYKLQQE